MKWHKSITNNSNKQSVSSSEDRMSFSAFHSQKKACPFQISISFITIYRITEFFDSPAIVRHSLELTKGLTYHLNLSQKQVVITRDQPVFAPGKKVKWMYLVIWIWKHVFERVRITTTGQLKVSCTVYRVVVSICWWM